uniref:Uncharacterized protein n=1 Tax=Arundo donax TaxID=35708 RepID=A0A0A9ETP4_ARUDO
MLYAHSARQRLGVWFDLYSAYPLATDVLIGWQEEV